MYKENKSQGIDQAMLTPERIAHESESLFNKIYGALLNIPEAKVAIEEVDYLRKGRFNFSVGIGEFIGITEFNGVISLSEKSIEITRQLPHHTPDITKELNEVDTYSLQPEKITHTHSFQEIEARGAGIDPSTTSNTLETLVAFVGFVNYLKNDILQTSFEVENIVE